jgi:hypothetical protein
LPKETGGRAAPEGPRKEPGMESPERKAELRRRRAGCKPVALNRRLNGAVGPRLKLINMRQAPP